MARAIVTLSTEDDVYLSFPVGDLMSRDDQLQSLLDAAGVTWAVLPEDERAEAETQWRAVYGRAFRGRPRLRDGSRAEFEFSQQPAGRWILVPMSKGVDGTSVDPRPSLTLAAYECEGPLVPLGAFNNVEFAVSPSDLSWTMLYTHEDHSMGGPYFIRREWMLTGREALP